MEKRKEQSMSDVETDEAKKARQQARQMGQWLKQRFEAGRLERLYKQAGLSSEETGLLGKVIDPTNTDEFVIMDSAKRQLVIEIFGRLEGAPKIEQ
jgi:hypothetical protein